MAEIIKINDNTWRFEEDIVRYFLLCGTEKALLVDTGMESPNARELAESVTDLPIILINTHSDKDHISGNAAFDRIYMNPSEEARYRSFGGEGEIVPILEGQSIDLGGRIVSIIDIPGHTPGSIALLDVETASFIRATRSRTATSTCSPKAATCRPMCKASGTCSSMIPNTTSSTRATAPSRSIRI